MHLGQKTSEETKMKQSESNLGQVRSEETRANLRLAWKKRTKEQLDRMAHGNRIRAKPISEQKRIQKKEQFWVSHGFTPEQINDQSFLDSLCSGLHCMDDLVAKTSISADVWNRHFRDNGFEKQFPRFISHVENRLQDEVEKFIPIERNCRSVIKRVRSLELDIFIPSKNIAVEINGVYWHSGKDLIEKIELCKEKGIQLLQFTDLQLNDHFDLIVSMILAKCGIFERRIFSRNLSVDMNVSSGAAKEFLSENHIQGNVNSRIRIGLRENDGNLISLICVGNSRFKKGETELLRFCSTKHVQVIGGFSRLISKINPPIVSYANRCWTDGSVYEKNGWTLTSTSPPSKSWFWKGKLLSRFQVMKHNLEKLLGDKFNPEVSGPSNLKAAGAFPVSDCGNFKYVLYK